MNRHCALILHAHVPWVRHPEVARCLEEDWIFEAVLETYLPLLDVFYRLREEDVPYRLTMNLSPPLLSMLNDELMRDRASAYMERTVRLAEVEAGRAEDPAIRGLAEWYCERLPEIREMYETRWNRDLVSAFKSLSDSGHIEITASGSTHGLLPLLLKMPEAARAQIQTGVEFFKECFEIEPAGFWLPECAYAPALVPFLQEMGIEWVMVEEHGLTNASLTPNPCPFHPAETERGLGVFARDTESSKQVWSAEFGYPGDTRYREFFRDVGLESPIEDLKDYLEGTDVRRFTGLKYYRVTGSEEEKKFYDPDLASRAAVEHALHFVESRAAQLARLESDGVDQPIVMSAFDAELFGHWWYEGPQFLERVLRETAKREEFHFTTPSEYLVHTDGATLESIEPVSSSWGEGGYFETWLSEENAWVYPHLHRRASQLIRAVTVLQENLEGLPEDLADHRIRCVKQMTRELMQAQSSDWAFLMRNAAARPYATERTEDHLGRFDVLWGVFGSNPETSGAQLAELEERNPIFPNLEWDTYRSLG